MLTFSSPFCFSIYYSVYENLDFHEKGCQAKKQTMIQWTFCRFHLLGFALKYLQISSAWSWFPASLIDHLAFFCHMSFFLLFSSSMILPSCFSMFERRLHTFFLLRSLDLDLNLSVCSIQHQKEPSSESFQSNYFSTIPLRIRLPFCPLIFRYSAWSSIVLNTRWSYSQSFASNCNGCLVSLPAW